MRLQSDTSLRVAHRPYYAENNGTTVDVTPAQFIEKFPRVMASLTLTVGGSATEDDEITVNLNLALLPGGKITKTIVVASGDTLISIAQKIAQAFSNDATFQSYGGVCYSLGAVVTFKWPGLVGNECTLTRSLSVDATLTGTISNSGAFSGGSGPVVPTENFSFTVNGATISFEANIPANVSVAAVKALVADKKPIY